MQCLREVIFVNCEIYQKSASKDQKRRFNPDNSEYWSKFKGLKTEHTEKNPICFLKVSCIFIAYYITDSKSLYSLMHSEILDSTDYSAFRLFLVLSVSFNCYTAINMPFSAILPGYQCYEAIVFYVRKTLSRIIIILK